MYMFLLKKYFGRYPFFLGNGGILGLTEGEDKFHRWKICGPELARVVSHFENSNLL